MNSSVLLLGASGALGLEIAKRLKRDLIPFRAQTSSQEGMAKLLPYTNDIWVVDPANNPEEVTGITLGMDAVISGMGKSVSLFTNSPDTFNEVDHVGNAEVLLDALKNKVPYYIYVSIKEAGHNDDFEIPKSHKKFEDKLTETEIPHCILRPVGMFSGLHDLAIMAKRKMIPIIGDGEARTNSISQDDMAEVVITTLKNRTTGVQLIGGPEIHTRLEMAEMIQDRFGAKIVKIPKTIADIGAFLPRFFDKNFYDKTSFFKYICTHDMIGDKHGVMTFKQYLHGINENDLP